MIEVLGQYGGSLGVFMVDLMLNSEVVADTSIIALVAGCSFSSGGPDCWEHPFEVVRHFTEWW